MHKLHHDMSSRSDNDLLNCKCGLCEHGSRRSYFTGGCYCCDLEDIFAILSQQEFEPQSRIVTKDML
jgi:hypothetical protein